nr:hypothetical protein [Methylobacterium durans]
MNLVDHKELPQKGSPAQVCVTHTQGCEQGLIDGADGDRGCEEALRVLSRPAREPILVGLRIVIPLDDKVRQ